MDIDDCRHEIEHVEQFPGERALRLNGGLAPQLDGARRNADQDRSSSISLQDDLLHPGLSEDLPALAHLAAGQDDQLRGLQVFAVLRAEGGVDLAAVADTGRLHRSSEDLVILLPIAIGGADVSRSRRIALRTVQRRLEQQLSVALPEQKLTVCKEVERLQR